MELLSAYPFATKITTTGVLNLFGDIFAQVFIDGKGMSDIDWKRSGIFFALGVGFVGPALSVWCVCLNRLHSVLLCPPLWAEPCLLCHEARPRLDGP